MYKYSFLRIHSSYLLFKLFLAQALTVVSHTVFFDLEGVTCFRATEVLFRFSWYFLLSPLFFACVAPNFFLTFFAEKIVVATLVGAGLGFLGEGCFFGSVMKCGADTDGPIFC